MKREFVQAPPVVKACMQLVDAFSDTFKPVKNEEEADELFTVGKIREYFNAWPIPKMPDPLPPYLDELEKRGFAMQTGYDGQPAIFVVRWKTNGEMCGVVEEVEEKAALVRSGAQSVRAVIEQRKALYGENRKQQERPAHVNPFAEDDDDDDEGNEEENSDKDEDEWDGDEDDWDDKHRKEMEDALGTFGVTLTPEQKSKIPF